MGHACSTGLAKGVLQQGGPAAGPDKPIISHFASSSTAVSSGPRQVLVTVTSRPQLQAILGKMERQARDDWGRVTPGVSPGRCAWRPSAVQAMLPSARVGCNGCACPEQCYMLFLAVLAAPFC